MATKQATTWFLIGVAGLALYLCYRIAEPFLSPIFAAVALAIVFYPLHARIESVIRRPNVAATLSTTLVMLVVAIPAVFLGMAVTRELGGLYQSLSEKSAAQGGLSPFLMHLMQAPFRLVGRYIDLSQIDVRSTLLQWLDQISRYLVSFGARAVSNILSLILASVVVFFTLFFLFRDGPRIQQRTAAMLPLSQRHATKFVTGISETIMASVYGGIAVGFAQGSLTGLGFWVLGLSSPVVWGLAAALASLVPVVGTGMVWAPAVVVLLIGGHWVKALILAAWGAAVVAQIDAVVRPYVVSGRAKMHNLLIFFALLGGVQAFGIMGIFIGPVVVSVTIAVLDMLQEMNVSSQESAQSEHASTKSRI
jgi:predicted PurR-regulated permease PerM